MSIPTSLNKPLSKRNLLLFLIFLIILDFFWILGTKVSALLLDRFLGSLGNADTYYSQIQYLNSVFSVVVAITAVIWGLIVDRFIIHRKKILIISNGLWIITNIFLGLFPISIKFYAIVQICWGIAMGANSPIIYSYLGDLFEIHDRGRYFAIFATFLYLIKGGSDEVSGIIGSLLNSWTDPSLVMAIGGAITLTLFILFIKEPKLAQIEPEFKDHIMQGGRYSYHIQIRDLKPILKQRTNLLFLIQGIFGTIGVTIVNLYILYWFTSKLKDGLNMNSIVATVLLGFGAIIGALIGINLAGLFADRYFRQNRLDKMLIFPIICLFGEIIGYLLLVYIPQYPLTVGQTYTNPLDVLNHFPVFWQFIIIFNFCILFGTGIGPVVGMARTHINLPEHRGTVAALYDMTNSIGAAIGIIMGNYFTTMLDSFRLTIFYGSLFWLVSALLWISITRYINRDYAEIREIMKSRAIDQLEQKH